MRKTQLAGKLGYGLKTITGLGPLQNPVHGSYSSKRYASIEPNYDGKLQKHSLGPIIYFSKLATPFLSSNPSVRDRVRRLLIAVWMSAGIRGGASATSRCRAGLAAYMGTANTVCTRQKAHCQIITSGRASERAPASERTRELRGFHFKNEAYASKYMLSSRSKYLLAPLITLILSVNSG